MPTWPWERGEATLTSEMSHSPSDTRARTTTRAAHCCLPRTQQMSLLDGISPSSWAVSASSCLSCPVPALLLGRGLQGKAGLCLVGGKLCSACFILQTGAQTALGARLGTLASRLVQQSSLLGTSAPLIIRVSQDLASLKDIPGFSQEPHWVRWTSDEKNKPVGCWLGCRVNTAYQQVWRGQHLTDQKITESHNS